jgi:uracil phosphoribosyltransferase
VKEKIIFIGADHRGFKLKSEILIYLRKLGYNVSDAGTYRGDVPCDYPKIALAVAQNVARTPEGRGILVCMSGIGPTIVANKIRGAYAALCYNRKVAELARRHNNSNILVLGARFVNRREVHAIVKTWLTTEFEGGRHLRRTNQVKAIERRNRG